LQLTVAVAKALEPVGPDTLATRTVIVG
ncbi:MAG: hypothetical protein QOD49_606, partial [Actinomycetota bacterium]|nr:hypothetical protein [Actinomycetota bacterium]